MIKQKGAHKLDSQKTRKVKLPLDKPCEPPGKHPVQLRYFSSAVVGEGSNDGRRTCSHAASMPASAHDKWSRYATTVIICGPGGLCWWWSDEWRGDGEVRPPAAVSQLACVSRASINSVLSAVRVAGLYLSSGGVPMDLAERRQV